MSAVTLDEASVSAVRRPSEVFLRRGLIVLSLLAGIGLLCHFAMMFWAQNEFTQPESIVATQSTMLARDGTLYYDLKHYPYTVCAYMPLFYLLQAALIKLGVPALQAGRLLSFSALAGIFWLAWRLLILYTKDRYYAWLGTLLCASTSLLLSWGTVGQVDTLALFFAVAGFYYYARYALHRDKTLAAAAIFVLAALFTKQTYLACPAAIFVALLLDRPKTALRFAAGVGIIGGGAVLLLNAAMQGRFLLNVVFADIFPFAAEKVGQHVQYLLIGAGQLLLIVLIGFRRNLRGSGRAAFIYLGFSISILALTAPKIGSDSNYQIETTFLLILCSCLVLHSLEFFALLFRGSKVWVTLLQAPLAIHLLLNYRITAPFLVGRFAKEQMFRQQIANLRPYFSAPGRVLSAEMNASLHFRGRIEVEPLICKMLASTGVIDPEPLRRDIARESFATIILYQDLTRPEAVDPEVPSLPESQMREISKHYRLIGHVAGPYLAGVYLYKPAGLGAQ